MPAALEKNQSVPHQVGQKNSAPSPNFGYLLLQDGRRWLSFKDPLQVITAYHEHDINQALIEIENGVTNHGLYAAGFIAYEAAAAYGLAVHPTRPGDLPLLWFGLYDKPLESEALNLNPLDNAAYKLGRWKVSLDKARYSEAIEKIKKHIARGETYQVNFTMRLESAFQGDPLALFRDLSQVQKAGYGAFLDVGSHAVCSASPELFFQLNKNKIVSRPMKGTAKRGRTTVEDRQSVLELHNSTKDRAENVMIVDMIRNDLGRIAEIGSVEVPQLFTIEKYPTLLQMTSTVTAESKATLSQIMEAMFPCASITGAPKVRTMEIIQELEPEARGLYTGTIGYWGPERQAQFNVAIRTVVIDRQTNMAQYGVGSGIVWDSDAQAEYEECRLKSVVLSRRQPRFELLETLLWTPDHGYFLLDYHLQRLQQSAEYFDFTWQISKLKDYLEKISRGFSEANKVRLLLSEEGQMTSQASSLAESLIMEPVRVGLAAQNIDSSNVWLYHKTTRRKIYQEALASRPDCDDVILWNERQEITEAAYGNIVLELDGDLFTPPISSGLLAGTFRRHLLQQGKIQERVLKLSDLGKDSKLYLINSVRKWIRTELVDIDLP